MIRVWIYIFMVAGLGWAGCERQFLYEIIYSTVLGVVGMSRPSAMSCSECCGFVKASASYGKVIPSIEIFHFMMRLVCAIGVWVGL